MTRSFEIVLRNGTRAQAVKVERPQQLEEVAGELTLGGASAGLVVIGGADGMPRRDQVRLRSLFRDVLAELAFRLRTAVVDGGTDSGVMRLMGRGRRDSGREFPLVGVAPEALVKLPGEPPQHADAAELEPNHTHFVLVPGRSWGDEGPWLARLGAAVGGGSRSATVLVNGGEIALRDAERSVASGTPVIVLAGSGRTADALAAAAAGRPRDEASARAADSGLIRAVDVRDRSGLAWTLEDVLAGRV